MQNLPTTFWAQLFARIGEKNPKFYSIIINNSLWFTVAAVVIPFVITDALPGMGIAVPQWLTYVNTKIVVLFSVLAGVGLGSAAVAKTTVQTALTPPLVEEDRPTLSNQHLADQVVSLNERIRLLEAGQAMKQ